MVGLTGWNNAVHVLFGRFVFRLWLAHLAHLWRVSFSPRHNEHHGLCLSDREFQIEPRRQVRAVRCGASRPSISDKQRW